MALHKVLFLCYGNLCRSPMAVGFFNAVRGEIPAAAESAGIGAENGNPAALLAVLEMKRRGIDISGHRSRNVASVNLSHYGEIVALDREIASLLEKVAPDHPKLRIWNVADPYGGSTADYRDAADRLRMLVEQYLDGWKPEENR